MKTTLYKLTKQRKVNVKLLEDTKYCDIWGSCVTDDGSLLLADYNNRKLKPLNMSTETITDFVTLISPPNSVCLISKTEAAVSLSNNTVQFVALVEKLTATRTLTFYHNCEGLTHVNDKLVISNGTNSVYIHDFNGKELRKITKNCSGNDIFKNTRHVANSTDGRRVFVADWNKGLITISVQGHNLSTLSERQIKASGCRGVCTDGRNVFVCGNNSGNVVQIGWDDKLLGQIGTFKKPMSVCFDSQKRRLFVTSYYDNDVNVLELE